MRRRPPGRAKRLPRAARFRPRPPARAPRQAGGAAQCPVRPALLGPNPRQATNMLHLQAPRLVPRGPAIAVHTLQKSMESLVVRGATQHNLKNVSCELPRNQLVVITGPSGSGKSSLAFDTIYAEGQRRYVESLSAYARQFLDQLPKPAGRKHRGPEPGDRHRAKGPRQEPALHRRHGHRNRGLPALAVRAHRRSPLPEVRQGAARVHRARDRRLDLVPR